MSEFDINALVNASLSEMAESGRLAQVITKHVEKSIEDSIKDAVSWNSEFQKTIKEAIKTAINVDFSGVGITSYNDMIVKVIKSQLDQHMQEAIARDVSENLKSLLSPAPSEYKLSHLVDEFKKWIVDSYQQEDTEITLIIESPYRDDILGGYREIYLDKDSGTNKRDCKICITIDVNKNNKIVSMAIDEKDYKKQLFIGRIYGFERMLFQFYTSGTSLILDEGDCDTYFNSADD